MTPPHDASAAAEPSQDDNELPTHGRVVEGRRKVRMGDAGPDRRARLDALARYLHDVAEDDAATATLPSTVGWVLRSTRMEIGKFPTLGEDIVLHTFCSATARRWAERTTIVRGANGARVRGVSIWVAVDTTTGAPARLGEWFFDLYGPSAGGKQAAAKLVLGMPSAPVVGSGRPWPLRRSDFDAWAHVNNAIAWAAVEDAVQIDATDSVVALLEHHAPIASGSEPLLATERDGNEWTVWLLDPGGAARVLVASHVEVRPGATSSVTA